MKKTTSHSVIDVFLTNFSELIRNLDKVKQIGNPNTPSPRDSLSEKIISSTEFCDEKSKPREIRELRAVN